MATRKPYPSDVSDEEWAFVAPYLALVGEDAPQRNHDLREVFDGLRWIVRTGSAWRYMPHDLPPWEAVYQQTRRWLQAGVFEEMVHDLRVLLRLSGAERPILRQPYWTVAPCNARRRAALGAATTGRSARKVRR
jgi:transposase